MPAKILPVVNRWNKINNNLFPETNCLAIVPFNKELYSTIGLPRITKYLRDITYLNSTSLDILVGLLLGDAYFKKGANNSNIRIGFKQSIINFPFFWDVFAKLSHFCSSFPRAEIARLKDVKYKDKSYLLVIM